MKKEMWDNIEKLSELRSNYSCFDEREQPYYHALSLGIEGIKALEQEPILDKIRAEIDKARFVNKDTRICKNALASGLEVAMEIIDKYREESEDKECR